MKLQFSTKTNPSHAAIIGLCDQENVDKGVLGKSIADFVELSIKAKTCPKDAGKALSTHRVEGTRMQKLILFNHGKAKDITEKTAREQGASIIRAAKGLEETDLQIIIPQEMSEHIMAFTEGMIMGDYNPAHHKTGKEAEEKQKKELKSITLITKHWGKDHTENAERGMMIGQAVNYTRNLVNAPPNMVNTEAMVSEAKTIAKNNKYDFTDITKPKLEKLKMGGILAVNKGSKDPAHMVILEHKGAKEDPILIVGKGIIFDSGGVNLKPSSSLNEMHLDMAGAATVLGTFQLLKKLNIKRHVVGILPVTDNAIDANSYRPSEIITTYSGKTVEINNTDAEGRMILCDALNYGIKQFKPKYTIDLATLTGACMVALGYRTAGLFGNDDKLIELIKQAASKSDEPVCHMPITDADEKSMKGKVADLTNLADCPYGGAARAAAFLKEFVEGKPWAHLDIAGPSYTKEPKPYENSMATGYGVRLLIDLLQSL